MHPCSVCCQVVNIHADNKIKSAEFSVIMLDVQYNVIRKKKKSITSLILLSVFS